jgi:hypothetical protein
MRRAVTILWTAYLALLCGCARQPVVSDGFKGISHEDIQPAHPNDPRFPTLEQWRCAVQLGREYAVRNLRLTQAQIANLKADAGMILTKENVKSLVLNFYDPRRYPEDRYLYYGWLEPMLGGFPTYFRITIDLQTWKVTGHYASPE